MADATVFIDGGSRGNPGLAAFAFVLKRPGLPDVEHAETMGTATNNVAEYSALLAALERAIELEVGELQVFSDSELLVKQMNGEYKVKNEELRTLFSEAGALRRRLGRVTLSHVRREQNKRADELCNVAMDAEAKKAAPATKPAAPAGTVGDATVRADAVACLRSAATAWAAGGIAKLPAEAVWDQLWSILEDGGVLKKRK